MPENTKVIVGLSGGVDSSVAALLLREQGYEVEGLFMKNWEEDDGTPYCSAREDCADAQAVADHLGIRMHTANFAAEYWDRVFAHFLDEYRAGRTPNPDILCNKEIKFRAFLDYARDLGAERIATGHYARRGEHRGRTTLLKGLDQRKDQSYFLHTVGRRELARALFPVGELDKDEVRARARAAGLRTHDKKDSTGICFIGERRFGDFLRRYLPAQPGEIQTPEGEVLGEHQGLMYHTLGQRQGLGIGGRAKRAEAPWYVADKVPERNVLIVVQGNEHPALYADSLWVRDIAWIDERAPELPFRGAAKVRYRQPDQDCVVTAEGGGFRVRFDAAQRAITPGQSAVIYRDEHCLGGGVIERARSGEAASA